ncbi:uncharacterized protein LOC106174600 [Lingula anatina]|uniref:Uncharacterized protein LOC106174600 n=1 Tax=Lingula anatina TaxID=7574 RepID=A0A1S3JNW7_LINAN|nr:uncharacterized protein LOC106174600 [Lingula anatina]|eukprot:XP_013411684.1 uncharacterized protein LOC106174600 [Lingula anatina]
MWGPGTRRSVVRCLWIFSVFTATTIRCGRVEDSVTAGREGENWPCGYSNRTCTEFGEWAKGPCDSVYFVCQRVRNRREWTLKWCLAPGSSCIDLQLNVSTIIVLNCTIQCPATSTAMVSTIAIGTTAELSSSAATTPTTPVTTSTTGDTPIRPSIGPPPSSTPTRETTNVAESEDENGYSGDDDNDDDDRSGNHVTEKRWSHDSRRLGAIIGGVLGCMCLLVSVIIICLFVSRKGLCKKSEDEEVKPHENEMYTYSDPAMNDPIYNDGTNTSHPAAVPSTAGQVKGGAYEVPTRASVSSANSYQFLLRENSLYKPTQNTDENPYYSTAEENQLPTAPRRASNSEAGDYSDRTPVEGTYYTTTDGSLHHYTEIPNDVHPSAYEIQLPSEPAPASPLSPSQPEYLNLIDYTGNTPRSRPVSRADLEDSGYSLAREPVHDYFVLEDPSETQGAQGSGSQVNHDYFVLEVPSQNQRHVL